METFYSKMVEEELDIPENIADTVGLLQIEITIKQLFESIAEGVIIINQMGKIVFINQQLAEMSGYTKQEVLGRGLSIFMKPDKHQQHQQHLQHFFTAPRARPMGVGLEINLLKKDGSSIPVEISISFIETDSGRLGLGFITDNSKRKQAIDALMRRNIELDAYAHTIAHDLRASISGIEGFSKILLEDHAELSEAEREKYIEIIAKGSKKLNSVIKEILLFASIDQSEIQLATVDMKQSVAEACSRLRYQIEQSGANILIDEDLLDCTSYGPWVEEVWFNYLCNALKHGGASPRITIHSEPAPNGFIKYSVRDDGPGMSEAQAASLFQNTPSPTIHQQKVTGLGLSIVKRIVEKLGGCLSLESQLGKGSTFSFFLKA